MNFTIDFVKLGELPMINLIILGIFALLIVLVWRLPDIISEVRKFKSDEYDKM